MKNYQKRKKTFAVSEPDEQSTIQSCSESHKSPTGRLISLHGGYKQNRKLANNKQTLINGLIAIGNGRLSLLNARFYFPPYLWAQAAFRVIDGGPRGSFSRTANSTIRFAFGPIYVGVNTCETIV